MSSSAAVSKTPLDVETKLMEVVPKRYLLHAHHWLILHGRYTRIARRPLCEKCLIADLCKWPGKTVLPPPNETPRWELRERFRPGLAGAMTSSAR